MTQIHTSLMRTLARMIACCGMLVLTQVISVESHAADQPSAQDSAKQAKIEIPWIKGAFRHVLNPPGQKDDPKKRRWYINDHCFFVDHDNAIHWFGITNPYPAKGGYYGPGTHMHVGHASAKHPFGPWTEHKDAVTLPEGSKGFVGACFVVRHGGTYFMVYNHGKGFTTAVSRNLYDWKIDKDVPVINLGNGTRDPCIVRQDDGTYFLYCTAGEGQFGAVQLGQSTDMRTWKKAGPVLVSDIRGAWGPLESPFVHRRGDAYYLFINHSHHQYAETIVFRSEDPKKFDWQRPLCTVFGHAMEIFEWNGKTYISHCGIEDRHWGKKTGLYLAELGWTTVEEKSTDNNHRDE